jgi:hypothetical protein
MRQSAIILFCAVAALSSAAQATTYDDYDFHVLKDNWGYLGWPDKWIGESWSSPITLDITGDDEWPASVDEAWLELDFTNDQLDTYSCRWRFKWIPGLGILRVRKWDNREFVHISFEGAPGQGVGEVDNGQQSLSIDPAILDDGTLIFQLRAHNEAFTGMAWLDHARLYGNFTDLPPTNPVPEPLTLSAVALSAAGLGGYLRRRRRRG